MKTFDEFYAAYPRHVGRAAALKAWLKIPPLMSDTIFDAMEAQKANNWKNEPVQFIPHASTWLNQERWLDAIEPPRPRKGAIPAFAQPVINEAEADRDFRRFMGMEPT